MKKERKMVWVFPSENVNRCPVHLVDKYISLCPDVGVGKKANFYLRGLEKCNPAQWYGEAPVGKNTLTKVVKKLLKSANLDGYFTNHSLHQTSAMRLFQAGIDGKIVREITGHASDAINKYQITSNEQKSEVSGVLVGGKIEEKEKKVKKIQEEHKAPPPSLELSVVDTSLKSNMKCSCKGKSFDISNGEQLSTMINDIVSKRKTGKAKIKLEIEFSE